MPNLDHRRSGDGSELNEGTLVRRGVRATEQLGLLLYGCVLVVGAACLLSIGVPESAELSRRRNTVLDAREISDHDGNVG
jgi:hypothetical protein